MDVQPELTEKICRIAIFRSGALGDFVFTLPVIAALRNHFKGVYIQLISSPSIAPLAFPDKIINQNSAHLTPLFYPKFNCPQSTLDLFSDMDLIIAYKIDTDGSLATNLRKLRCPTVMLHDPRPDLTRPVHIVDHLLAPLEKLGIQIPDRNPRIRLKDEDLAHGFHSFNLHLKGLRTIAIHPGSGGKHKCWPLKNYLQLSVELKKLNLKTVFILGEVEQKKLKTVLKMETDSSEILFHPDIMKLAAILSQIDLFVGNDSGPGHVASAIGCPTIMLFGPTDPKIWGPRTPDTTVLSSPDGSMDSIPVHSVLKQALKILNLSDGS